MALVFADGFDFYTQAQLPTRYTQIGAFVSTAVGGPGRLGYGQYLTVQGGQVLKGINPLLSIIVGFAYYNPQSQFNPGSIFGFSDASGGVLGNLSVTASGQITGPGNAASAPATLSPQAWTYIEAQITFSSTNTGSCTIRVNGQTVANVASTSTAPAGSGPCALVGPYATGNGSLYIDDLYVLNTTAPNNTFLGDIKILPLYPTGNGRISGFSRFGGTSLGNYTAVNEVPPDGDASYVFSNTAGTIDAYTITAVSNVSTIKAVQLDGYVRKDDTPSRIVSLGVGNGTVENFDAGTSVNTSYTYITRQLDQNPLTAASWTPADFTTLQSAIQLIS